SDYLHDVIIVGDQIEVRGPIGGYFVWEASRGGPLLLIAGGSGVVPLMAMLRHRAAAGSPIRTRLLYSSPAPADVLYRHELDHMPAADSNLEVFHTFTRSQPPGWTGYARRIDAPMLREVAGPLGRAAQAYLCGPTLLVETAANGLTQIG